MCASFDDKLVTDLRDGSGETFEVSKVYLWFLLFSVFPLFCFGAYLFVLIFLKYLIRDRQMEPVTMERLVSAARACDESLQALAALQEEQAVKDAVAAAFASAAEGGVVDKIKYDEDDKSKGKKRHRR